MYFLRVVGFISFINILYEIVFLIKDMVAGIAHPILQVEVVTVFYLLE